jgi:hypothetical protein
MKKILIVLSLLIASVAYADHEEHLGEYYMAQAPILCASSEYIDSYLNHYNFKPSNISLGREGMVETGKPVYMVTYYVNSESGQTTATIDVPNASERCLLFHTFDLYIPN